MTLLRRGDPSGRVPAGGSVNEVTVTTEVEDGVDLDDASVEGWAALATKVLVGEGVCGPAELTLTFVDEAAMATLNLQWMDEEGPTDVLSFPLDAEEDADMPGMRGMLRLLGDVVICPAVARRYAAEHGRRPDDELALLVVHGVLHVLGHDHAEVDEEAVMHGREDHHLREHHDAAWTRSTS